MSDVADLDEKTPIEHEFSNPWEDSDLVLVVEDQKLHVHRTILKIVSPVFKSMFSSDFKEKDSKEVTLPGKKVDEFVDFLRQIYPSIDGQITLKNIKYIYSLADEYQMPKVKKDCRMFLSSVKKAKNNAMDMLLLAQELEAEEARQQCYEVIKNMNFAELERARAFSNLDGQSMKDLLLPIMKRYNRCIKDALPWLLGSLDAMVQLSNKATNNQEMERFPSLCSSHNQRWGSDDDRIHCNSCKAMFVQMAHYSKSSSNTHFKKDIVGVLEEMTDLTEKRY